MSCKTCGLLQSMQGTLEEKKERLERTCMVCTDNPDGCFYKPKQRVDWWGVADA